MKLYYNNTELDIDISDESYRYRTIMGENSLTIYFSLTEYLEVPKGAYCTYQAEQYTLTKPAVVTQKGARIYEYILILESEQYKLHKYKLRNTIDRRLKFSYTAKPHEHLQLLVDNLNQRDSEWKVGECVEAIESCISYNHNYCDEALKMMSDVFKTEYEINGKTISLRKIEYNKKNPLVLSYGRGGGFKTGIKRDNSDESEPVEILFVQGGEKNIDLSQYGSKELLLPKNQTLEYEGRAYISDSDGFYIRRVDKELLTGEEDSLDCSNISPQRIGIVSELIVTNTDKHFYDFVDKDIPENLDYNKYTIKGEKLTIIFQSGMLAGDGKVFEVIYKHKDRKFEIVPQDIDGVTMPDNIFKPVIGNKYAVFGCMLPDEYICDNATKTGASWEMFREGVKFLYEHEDPRFSFTGELDGIWTKKDWLNIGGKIVLGGYTKFTASFVPDGILIRIKGIKDFLNKPHSPVIELSNTTASAGVSGELEKIGQNEVVAEDNKRELINFTKRRFRDAQETIGMLEDSLLNFSGSINPVTVRTMQLLAGDESLQFRFVNNITIPETVSHEVVFDAVKKILIAEGGIVQHMTLGINSISSVHDVSEYKFWSIEPFNSPVLTDTTKKYYLYIKVSKTETSGVFYLSETAIAIESIEGYYHLLAGILNSEYDGDRNYIPLYGYTEILPGRVTTDRIVSPDGSYWDFVRKAFKLGDALSFNVNGDSKLRLKGTILQSESGDESLVGVFRGNYNNAVLYFAGDEIVHAGSSYRCLQNCPTAGIMPINTTYWSVVASKGIDGSQGLPGVKGADGIQYYTWIRYSDNANGVPNDNNSNRAYIGIAVNQTNPVESDDASKYQWSKVTGSQGIPGQKGADGKQLYTWMKYADNSSGGGISDNGTGKMYIGFAYNKETITESNNPLDYSWSLIKGEKGDYTEYRYAKNGSTVTPPALTSTDSVPVGWSDVMLDVNSAEYLWMTSVKKTGSGSLLGAWAKPIRTNGIDGKNGADGEQGIPGVKGADGIQYYTWIRYSDNANGVPNDNNSNRAYIGIAVNQTNPVESDDASKYQWSKVTGSQGIPGQKGADGKQLYTWMKYADNSSGGGISDNGTGKMYIGFAYNKETITESNNPSDYSWSLIKGADGQPGPGIVYMGDYSASKTYYGNEKAVVVVKYSGQYYISRVDAVSFTGIAPTNTSKWNPFGAQFESIATGLLFAELAYIENLGVRNLSTSVSGKRVAIDGQNNNLFFYNENGELVIKIDTQDGIGNYGYPIISVYKELADNYIINNVLDAFGFYSQKYQKRTGGVITPVTLSSLYYDTATEKGKLIVKNLPVVSGSRVRPLYYNEVTGEIGLQ